MKTYRHYLDGLIPIGELFATPFYSELEEDEAKGFDENGHGWTADAVRKMREPVSLSDYFYPTDAETKKRLVEMAWYVDPAGWEPDGEWDDRAVTKMREPVYQGWRIYMSLSSLKKLVELA